MIKWFIFSRIKKDEVQGKEKCHSKSMMSNETNERLKIDTQHVPLSQNSEEKVRGTGIKVVWDDVNEQRKNNKRIRERTKKK